jgi:hypothetical protein
MACPNCGSWAVKADRGLAGRMVCARCGQPLGLGASARIARRRGRQPRMAMPKRWRIWLTVAGLVGVSAALAARAPAPPPDLRELPRLQPTSPPQLGFPPPQPGAGM